MLFNRVGHRGKHVSDFWNFVPTISSSWQLRLLYLQCRKSNRNSGTFWRESGWTLDDDSFLEMSQMNPLRNTWKSYVETLRRNRSGSVRYQWAFQANTIRVREFIRPSLMHGNRLHLQFFARQLMTFRRNTINDSVFSFVCRRLTASEGDGNQILIRCNNNRSIVSSPKEILNLPPRAQWLEDHVIIHRKSTPTLTFILFKICGFNRRSMDYLRNRKDANFNYRHWQCHSRLSSDNRLHSWETDEKIRQYFDNIYTKEELKWGKWVFDTSGLPV